MRRKRVWIPLAVLVILGLLIVGNLVGKGGRGIQADAEPIERRSIESWVRAPGLIQPIVSVDISSNVTGRVVQLYVEEGQRVERGDLLLVLDDTRYQSAVDQYEALLSAARSQLLLAEAQRDLAAQVLARREDLHARGLLSSEELETARVDLRVKEATVAAQGDEIARQEAALAESRRDLEETHFTAPIGGVITSLNLEEGENVLIGTMNNPGTVVLTIADLSRMEVEARINESDVVLVSPGQPVRIEVDAKRRTPLVGVVTTVGESGTRSSRDEGAEFQVNVTITEPPAWLRPGMSADVEILVATAEDVLTVPIQALVARTESTVSRWERGETGGDGEGRDDGRDRDDGEGRDDGRDRDDGQESEAEATVTGGDRSELVPGVFVLEEDEAGFRRIETGVRGESYVEVLSGVEEGETVLSGPYRVLRRLRHGEVVQVREDNEEAGR